jgi:hypothetical protein
MEAPDELIEALRLQSIRRLREADRFNRLRICYRRRSSRRL